MKHRIKNVIARIQAIARQTTRNASSLGDFQSSFDARLGAMAKTYDLLTESQWTGALLEEVLKSELVSIVGRTDVNYQATGPSVMLAAREALALGLVFHELTTNALKYGALAHDSGALRIGWDIADAPAGRRLRLEWREDFGEPVEVPQKSASDRASSTWRSCANWRAGWNGTSDRGSFASSSSCRSPRCPPPGRPRGRPPTRPPLSKVLRARNPEFIGKRVRRWRGKRGRAAEGGRHDPLEERMSEEGLLAGGHRRPGFLPAEEKIRRLLGHRANQGAGEIDARPAPKGRRKTTDRAMSSCNASPTYWTAFGFR
jgi:two-component sensor histidine kinase